MVVKSLLFTVLMSFAGAPPAQADAPPAMVESALGEALAVPGARVSVDDYRARVPNGCAVTAAHVSRPVTGSGRYSVRLTGAGCTAWAQVNARVMVQVAVTTRSVREGERIGPAVTHVERELRGSVEPVGVDDSAVAARTLPRGRVIERTDVRSAGTAAGQPIKVVARVGALQIEQTGRTISCGASRVCAVLPSGKHVEGRMDGDRLVVESP